MKNDLSTFEGLQKAYHREVEHRKRLQEALDRSDKVKVYRDGYEHAKDMVRAFRGHVSWASNEVSLDFAYQLGVNSVKSIFDNTSPPSVEKYNDTIEVLINHYKEQKRLLKEVFNLFKVENVHRDDLKRFLELEAEVEAHLAMPIRYIDSHPVDPDASLYDDEDVGED